MPRLPVQGGDDGQWGEILNTFLLASHNSDGSLKSNALSVTSSSITTSNSPTDGQVLKYTTANDLEWQDAASGSVSSVNAQTGVVVLDADDIDDAATTNKFVTSSDITNLGNLSGTNTGDQDLSGLVPKTTQINGNALSADVTLTKSDVGLANVDNTSDVNKPISTATQTALDLKTNDTSAVHKTGDETIAGIKTFSSSPVVPTPTTDSQAATKAYVDTASSAGGKYIVSSPINDGSPSFTTPSAVGVITGFSPVQFTIASETLIEFNSTLYANASVDGVDVLFEVSNNDFSTSVYLDPYESSYPSWAIVANKARIRSEGFHLHVGAYCIGRVPAGTWKVRLYKQDTGTITFPEHAGHVVIKSLAE